MVGNDDGVNGKNGLFYDSVHVRSFPVRGDDEWIDEDDLEFWEKSAAVIKELKNGGKVRDGRGVT